MTIPCASPRERVFLLADPSKRLLSFRQALHLLDRLERDEKDFAEVEALKSSSPATARPKVRQHITRSILTALDDLEEDLSRECRERGQVVRKVIELLHHGVDAQLSMVEGEKQELQGEVRGLVKEVTSLGAKADLARAAAVRAKIVEAGLRSRLAESRDEIDRLHAENDVLKADVQLTRARIESVGAGPLESSGRAWFSALGELLEGSAADSRVLGSLTSGLPVELAKAVRLIAAHSSMVHGELTLSRVAVRDIMAPPQLSDEEVQASSFLSSCDGEVQTIVGAVMEVAVGTESPYTPVDSAIQVGYSTDESESEASSPTPSEFDSEGDDEAVEEGDLEAAELLSSDFAKLIDPSLSGLEMSKGASKKAGVWSHTDLHSTIDRLYDALPGRFKATGERLKSVALSIMASLRQQHGIPSVVMKRAWQLLRSLIYWKSPPGHGTCITCSNFVRVLLGKVTFSDFRIMLYFRRLMRRRSKLKHDLRSFGVRRPESAVAMSLAQELFPDGMVVDDIVTAITAVDVWAIENCPLGPSRSKSLIVQSEIESRLISALLDGWRKKLESLSIHHMHCVEEAANAFIKADVECAGLLNHSECVVAAGRPHSSWRVGEQQQQSLLDSILMEDDGPSHVGLLEFALKVGGERSLLLPESKDAAVEVTEFVTEALVGLGLEGHAHCLLHGEDPIGQHIGRQYRSRLSAIRRYLADGEDDAVLIETISLLAHFISTENSRRSGTPSSVTQEPQQVIEKVLRPLLESAKATRLSLFHNQIESNLPTD